MESKSPSKSGESKFDDLPLQTVVEILLKLPVKFIIRSTLVSKTWHSLITNCNFISAQIKRSISCCDENVVLIVPPVIAPMKKLCSLVSAADTSSLIEKFEIPFCTRFGRLQLVASLNGLLLLCFLDITYLRYELYLWNPCIRRHRALASTKLYDMMSRKYFTVGLGFHKPTNDYRVVRIVYVADNTQVFGGIAPKVEIYSLRENTWKEIKDPKVPIRASANGAYVNGSFYWLRENTIHPTSTYDREQLWILSFDFDTEEFGEVLKLPDEVTNCLEKPAKFKLMEFEGSLCLCVFDGGDVDHRNKGPDKPSCIWLMRSENGVISWTLRFRFLLKEGGRPMNITKSGSLILESRQYSSRTRSIISCNLKSMHYKDLGFCDVLDGEDTMSIVLNVVDTSFMESLVMYERKK